MTRDELIEEAAKRILMVTQGDVSAECAWSVQYPEVQEELLAQARAALAVFEQVQSPSDDEQLDEIEKRANAATDGAWEQWNKVDLTNTLLLE